MAQAAKAILPVVSPNAAGAYVATQLTCADAMPTIGQVEALMEGSI